jgi:hypothetical protein
VKFGTRSIAATAVLELMAATPGNFDGRHLAIAFFSGIF